MSVEYKNGAIIKSDKMCNRTYYDVANNLITAQFDGMGNVTKYAVMNKFCIFDIYNSLLTVGGKAVDLYAEKQVVMQGRRQITQIDSPEGCTVRYTQFLDDVSNAIYTEISVLSSTDTDVELTVNIGMDFTSYLKELFSSRLSAKVLLGLPFKAIAALSKKSGRRSVTDGVAVIQNDVAPDFYFDVAADESLTGLETNKQFCNQWRQTTAVKAGASSVLRYVVSAGSRKDFTYTDVAQCYLRFNDAMNNAKNYIDSIEYPDVIVDEFHKSFYHSLMNCALSNYKSLGKFKGFLAGIVYQFPCRTYFRDSYWTVLPVLSSHPELVRNEILTLANGIDKNGKCPSAVKYNFKNWWGNHYDSPSLFVIELYDYIAHSGDKSILSEKWRGGNVYDAAVKVLTKLRENTDSTHLLFKDGEYNRRDWCDNVFRTGYVTYDEALYARALFCLSELSRVVGKEDSAAEYAAEYEAVKSAINELLWDEDKGWFVNYRGGFTEEDNLSIDTIPIVLFNLTDEGRAKRILANMERLLESRNNAQQSAGDFGVLSVYPFYKNSRDVVLKSSFAYYYHNGGDWPYWDGAYAYAKLMYGMDYEYPLTRWFTYNVDKGNYTPVEFFSPAHKDGSLLQAWSSVGAFVYTAPSGDFFNKTIK